MSRWNVRTITKGSDDESCSLSDVQVQTRHGRSVKPPSKYKQGLCLGLTMTPPPKKNLKPTIQKKNLFFYLHAFISSYLLFLWRPSGSPLLEYMFICMTTICREFKRWKSTCTINFVPDYDPSSELVTRVDSPRRSRVRRRRRGAAGGGGEKVPKTYHRSQNRKTDRIRGWPTSDPWCEGTRSRVSV